MDYKKIEYDNYSLHLIKTTRFKDINVCVRFTKDYNKRDYVNLKILENVIVRNGTKRFKNISELSIESENLYRSDINVLTSTISNKMVFEFKLFFINPKYTEDFVYEESFNLLNEIMRRPIVFNNKFNENVFNLQKQSLIESIKGYKDMPDVYAKVRFNEMMYDKTILAENNYKNIKLFENTTNEDIYKIYIDLFKDYKIDVLVLGNFENDRIINNVNSLLKGINQVKKENDDLSIIIDNKKEKVIKESFNSDQSVLYLGAVFNNITNYEKDIVFPIYNTILGSMNNSVLFVKVREDNSLCYSINSLIDKFSKTLIINSGINANNYDKALLLIKESLKSMEDKNVIKKNIENAIKTVNITLDDYYDSKNSIISFYHYKEFMEVIDIEEKRKLYNNVNVDDVVKFAKKIHIQLIYLLEGVKDEKN